jgi:tetratricopeptide (TPR) repeat protein
LEAGPKASGLYAKQPASTSSMPRGSSLPPRTADQLNRYLEAARAAADGGNPTAAANFYRLASEIVPNEPSIKTALDECMSASTAARTAGELIRAGDDLARGHHWEAALDHYVRAVEHAPKSSHALYKTGGALYKLGKRLGDAEEYVKRSLEADPKRADAWLLLARIHLESGATNDAYAAVQQAQKLAPADPRVARFLAKLERP